jgi:hypothetical protein
LENKQQKPMMEVYLEKFVADSDSSADPELGFLALLG